MKNIQCRTTIIAKKLLLLCTAFLLLTACGAASDSPPVSLTPAADVTPAPPTPTAMPTLSAPTETPVVPDEPNAADYSDMIKGEIAMVNEMTHQPPEGFAATNDDVSYGTLTLMEYDSATTGAVRKCYVYTPADYDPNVTYPVLYLLHGIGGTHTEWLGGNPVEILGNLAASGDAPPMIVVIPNVRAMENDGFPADMLGQENIAAFDNFINDLRDDLMPFIRENYPVSLKREENAIAGLSMGGREALFIGLTMADEFGYIGAFSPAPGLLSNAALNYPGQLTAEEMTLPEEYKDSTLVFICNGNQDGVVHNIPEEYHRALDQNGIGHVYYTIDGGHDFTVWKNGLYYFAGSIFS